MKMKMKMKMKMNQSGFTLIELVMVIVILGILAAVALPKFVDLSTEATSAQGKYNTGSNAESADTSRAACIVANSGNASTCDAAK